MKLGDLTPESVNAAIKEFFDVTSGHVTWLARTVGNENTSIPKTPRRMGSFQFDYFFAAQLDELARYALGGMQASGKYVKDLCDTVEKALFGSPAGQTLQIDPAFYDTTLGFIVKACRARAAVRRDGGPKLAADDVRLLAGLPDKLIKAAGLLKKGGDAVDDVRDFLEKNGAVV